jgi:gliding motility-associated-like protein
MQKSLRHIWLLLVGVLITLSSQQAQASHAIGGDMSYTNVGPGLYLVTYRFYRDCSGISAPSEFPLTYEGTGCGPNNRANPGGNTALLPRLSAVGNPYCGPQNQQSRCDSLTGVPSNGRPNYNIYTYGAIINLGATGAAECTEWVLSTNLNARPNTRNLGFGTDLYTEVRFNNKLIADDSSPAFPSAAAFQPLIFTCDTTANVVASQVIDPDNLAAGTLVDSLVYTSLRPLSAANTPIAYTNGHSLNNPMRVWTGRLLTGQGPNLPFRIDPVTGTISFTSGLYTPNSADDEDNKFAISIGVESWRKINGVRRKISTVRRDILVVIFRCRTRAQPPIPNGNGDSAITNIGLDSIRTVSTRDTIRVDACNTALIDVEVRDNNGDSVRAFIVQNQLPGQATITRNAQGSVFVPGVLTIVKFRLSWAPDASTVGGVFPVTIRLLDNGCPLPGRTDVQLVLKVVRRQFSSVGLFTSNNNGDNDTLCVGQITRLVATTQRAATIGLPPQPATYAYEWFPDPDNTIISTNGDTAIVRPLRTTRYRMQVVSPQGCIDTSSILVRVNPKNIAVAEPDTICNGQTATISLVGRKRQTGPDGTPIVYTYKWVDSTAINTSTPSTLLSDSTATTTATPRTTTRYYGTILSSLGCTDTTSVVVFSRGDYPVFDTTQNTPLIYRSSVGTSTFVLKASNDDGRFTYRIRGKKNLGVFSDTSSATLSINGLPVTTSYQLVAYNALGCEAKRTFTISVPLEIANIITPNGDGKNDVFAVDGIIDAELKIFNRWGKKIEEWSSYDNKWGGGDYSSGIYYYYLRNKLTNETYKGWFEIVK